MTSRKISGIELFLRQHTKKDLESLYEKLFDETVDAKWTHDKILSEIASRKSELDIIENWSKKIGTFNTSVTVQLISNKVGVRQKNILEDVKKKLGKVYWDKLLKDQKIPKVLTTIFLISVRIVEGKIYFLIAEKGRTRTMLNGFDLIKVVEPAVGVIVWDDAAGILQVRGSISHDRAIKYLGDLLKWRDQYNFATCHIDNSERLKRMAKEIGGKVSKSKLQDSINSKLKSVELTAKVSEDVYESSEYSQLMKEGFGDYAGGICFKYKKEEYVIWIGFKKKTIWLQKGSMDELVMRKIVNAYIKHGA